LQKARDIREWLISEGWPANAFILADSGNGGHLAVKVDLPNDTTARDLVKACLDALSSTFSDGAVKVDTTTYNAARIWKIYGTMARKGSSTTDRPHRLASIIEAPDAMETVCREQLEALAAKPKEQTTAKSGQNGAAFDPVRYAEDHGATITKVKSGWVDPTGKRWTLAVLDTCPFNADHNRGEAWLGVAEGGERGFGCPHEGCQSNGWQELKRLWGSPNGNGSETANEAEPLYDEICKERGSVISEDELKEIPRAFNPRLEVHLEADNFLSKYIEYAKTTSDAYEEYHFASGLVLLSVAADRQIVISMRHGDIYPNLWIFPLGDSTVSRKTTAHKLCKLILKNKYPRKSLPSSFSPEALMDAIASTPQCYYLKDEAGSLLASMCKDYMQETRDFLAEIFECDDYYRKLKKSETDIRAPYITQYLMTTPDNLKEYTTPLDLTSGWLLRYLWMYPNYPREWKPFVEKDAADFDRFTTITGEYNLVAEKLTRPRTLSMSPESMSFFQEWQRAIEETAMAEADNLTKALAGRLMTYAVKMAALFTIGRADFDENSIIELHHIQEAARLVDEYFLPIGKIIIDEVARAESKNVQDKIIGTIKRSNGLIKHRDLLRALHMKLKDVEEAIEALILSEEIESKTVKSKKGNILYYRLRECHSVIVSHKPVYKGNNEGGLYTPSIDTMTLRHMGQVKTSSGEGGDGEPSSSAVGPCEARPCPQAAFGGGLGVVGC
jgi:hypothetical protein